MVKFIAALVLLAAVAVRAEPAPIIIDSKVSEPTPIIIEVAYAEPAPIIIDAN